MQQLGKQLNLDENVHIAALKYYSKRSVEVFKLWEKVFAGSDRLVKLLSAPVDNVASGRIILEHQNAYRAANALAIAPAFATTGQAIDTITSTHDVFGALASAQNPKSISRLEQRITELAALATSKGLSLMSYSGGQTINRTQLANMTRSTAYHLNAANRDSRMAREFYRFLKNWKNAGGTLFVTGTSAASLQAQPSLGIKEYINQPNSETPKYQALLAFKRGERCWWSGC